MTLAAEEARVWHDEAVRLANENAILRGWITDLVFWVATRRDLYTFAAEAIDERFETRPS